MPLFPAFLKLQGRRCLVVGAGQIAEEKIQSLLHAGARILVVAPGATERVRSWARAKQIRWRPRTFRPADLAGAFVVIAATSSSALHAKIYRQARRQGVLCNCVDDPDNCNFYFGAVVRRGDLQIAISTAGHSPALAQRLRKKLEKDIGIEYERWVTTLGAARRRLFAKSISPARRRALLHALASEMSFERFLRSRGARKK
ncbi:MAG: bifunctional precorrin-2 dehydrogenase/sirohydrochlorin ferrochelatase [Candidatus Acidiferrales bacterium]